MDVRNNIERASIEYLWYFLLAAGATLMIGYQRLWLQNPAGETLKKKKKIVEFFYLFILLETNCILYNIF